MMVRTIVLTVVAWLGSALVSESLAQAPVASSCFELRVQEGVQVELPDSIQLVVESNSRGHPPVPVPIFLEDVATGQFTADGLVAVLSLTGRRSAYLYFRPEGDRMVGWVLEDERAHPDLSQPWQVEAHRFRCARRGP